MLTSRILALTTFITAWVGLASSAAAQTSPAPYDLASGDYTFTAWSPEAAAETYPPSMLFHTSTVRSDDAVPPAAFRSADGDWTCRYDCTQRARFQALTDDGIGLIETGNSQETDAGCLGDPYCSEDQGFPMGVVLALDTTDREAIRVQWTARTQQAQSRAMQLSLEARVGDGDEEANPFETIAASTYTTSATSGDSDDFDITLPVAFEDHVRVELRWRYQYVSGGGARSMIALDDITVSSDPAMMVEMDAGMPDLDAGVDAGTDAGTDAAVDDDGGVDDGGTDDGGAPEEDAGAAVIDAGSPGSDAGPAPMVDAGPAPMPGTDAGTPSVDAGLGEEDSGRCSCRAAGAGSSKGSATWLFALGFGALALGARRRRR